MWGNTEPLTQVSTKWHPPASFQILTFKIKVKRESQAQPSLLLNKRTILLWFRWWCTELACERPPSRTWFKTANHTKKSQDFYGILNPASIYNRAEGFNPCKEFNQLKWQWLLQNAAHVEVVTTVVSLFLNQEHFRELPCHITGIV